MSQVSFSAAEYLCKRKQTRRERFLAQMEAVVPWKALIEVIEPHYPRAGRGRLPYALESLLRIYLLQQWYGLSDLGVEETLYEITSMRQFGHTKVRYRGLVRNTAQLHVLFGLSSLWMARGRLLAMTGQVRPENG